jgi:hypothetical protein
VPHPLVVTPDRTVAGNGDGDEVSGDELRAHMDARLRPANGRTNELVTIYASL